MKSLCSHGQTPHQNVFLPFHTFLLTSKQGLPILPYLACQKLRQALGGVVTMVGFFARGRVLLMNSYP